MRRSFHITAHARERWAERVGRGCIKRAVRRSGPPGPEVRRRVYAGRGAVVLYDRRTGAVFLCEDVPGERRILTVLVLRGRR